MEFFAGLSVGLLLLIAVRFIESRSNLGLIERLVAVKAIAASPQPIETGAAITDFQAQAVLNSAPPKPEKSQPPVNPVKDILIDGMEFQFPSDSPLNKML